MVGRRGRYASWTIVGDAAQSSWSLPDEAASARAEALSGKDQNAFHLSTNYRNSREIFDLAAELARAAIPGADLPNAVRETGVDPRVREVKPSYLAEAVREATAALADELDGTIGVVAPVERLAEVEAWLGERDTERIPVLEAIDTKGLEFDGIVVVAPDEIVAESEAGIRTLYVVLTRATQQLDILGPTHHWHP
jgi:DNA helicase IV